MFGRTRAIGWSGSGGRVSGAHARPAAKWTEGGQSDSLAIGDIRQVVSRGQWLDILVRDSICRSEPKTRCRERSTSGTGCGRPRWFEHWGPLGTKSPAGLESTDHCLSSPLRSRRTTAHDEGRHLTRAGCLIPRGPCIAAPAVTRTDLSRTPPRCCPVTSCTEHGAGPGLERSRRGSVGSGSCRTRRQSRSWNDPTIGHSAPEAHGGGGPRLRSRSRSR